MPDHAAYAGVDEALRDDRSGFRIRLIVFRDELEYDRFAADGGLPRVQLVHRHLRAVPVVRAVVRLRTGERRGEADFHDRLRPARTRAPARTQRRSAAVTNRAQST